MVYRNAARGSRSRCPNCERSGAGSSAPKPCGVTVTLCVPPTSRPSPNASVAATHWMVDRNRPMKASNARLGVAPAKGEQHRQVYRRAPQASPPRAGTRLHPTDAGTRRRRCQADDAPDGRTRQRQQPRRAPRGLPSAELGSKMPSHAPSLPLYQMECLCSSRPGNAPNVGILSSSAPPSSSAGSGIASNAALARGRGRDNGRPARRAPSGRVSRMPRSFRLHVSIGEPWQSSGRRASSTR